MDLQILADKTRLLGDCFIRQGILLGRIIESTNRAYFVFRRIQHMAIRKPYKRKKNTQYSKPYKRNYPYWRGYPYTKDGFNICKPDIDKKRIEFLFDN